MREKKIYISGPMRGLPNFNFPAFNSADEYLTTLGWKTINPAMLDTTEPIGPTAPSTEYLRRDDRHLVQCGAIALLPGWEDSAGACHEAFIAADLGLEIFKLHRDSNVWYMVKVLEPSRWDILETASRKVIEIHRGPSVPPTLKLAEPDPVEDQSILLEAESLVNGDRQSAYGHPWEDFNRTARIWSLILGRQVTPEQVGLCMVGLKLSRECHAHKRDNLVDAAGYLETVNKVINARRRLEREAAYE